MKKVKDYYFYKAKKENYPARSVYKLEEIDKKYNIIKQGFRVLDLGAAPGSWSKYCVQKIGGKGIVVGIDKVPIQNYGEIISNRAKNFVFIQEDIFKTDLEKIKTTYGRFDAVISDLAPSTTGIRDIDQTRSYELCLRAYEIMEKILKKGGNFVCKIFQGPDFERFVRSLAERFEWVKIFKPISSRKESFEIYVIGVNFIPLESL